MTASSPVPRETLLQLARFAVVGTATAAIYVAGYRALRGHGAGAVVAAIASYLAAIAFQYVGHATFTFGGAARRPGEVPRFLASNGLGLALSAAVSAVFAAARLPDALASLVVVVGLPIVNWFVLRRWVFR